MTEDPKPEIDWLPFDFHVATIRLPKCTVFMIHGTPIAVDNDIENVYPAKMVLTPVLFKKPIEAPECHPNSPKSETRCASADTAEPSTQLKES